MTKKLIALLFCLAIAVVAQAQTNTKKNTLNQRVTRQVAKQTSAAAFEKSLRVIVYATYQVYNPSIKEYPYTEYETECSAVIINPKGDLAIKKDCYEALFVDSAESDLRLFVDMKNLGHYANDHVSFYYETENANRNLIGYEYGYLKFPLALRVSSQVRKKLETSFKAQDMEQLPEQTISRILEAMPKAKSHMPMIH